MLTPSIGPWLRAPDARIPVSSCRLIFRDGLLGQAAGSPFLNFCSHHVLPDDGGALYRGLETFGAGDRVSKPVMLADECFIFLGSNVEAGAVRHELYACCVAGR